MTSESKDFDDLENIWNEKPDIILPFMKVRYQYEQLCNEISYLVCDLNNFIQKS